MPSNHLILCRPLLLLPSVFPSIRVFSNESVLRTRWPKYWSCSLSISLSNEYSGLISFRMDWLDLLAVQGTLKSLLQHQGNQCQYSTTTSSSEGEGNQKTCTVLPPAGKEEKDFYTQERNDSLFSKWRSKNWTATCKRMKLEDACSLEEKL